MTTDLRDTLAARAARADDRPDTDRWLEDVSARHRHQQRRRRRALAAGGSSLAVVALAGAVVLATGDDGHQGPSDRAAGPNFAATDPVSSVNGGGDVSPDRLVAAPATPGNAPATLGLVPAGFDRVGVVPSATTYGPASAGSDASAFVGKVTVLIGDRYDQRTSGTRIAGYPARIEAVTGQDAAGYAWGVTFYYSSTIEIDIQIPRTAGLDRDQVRRLAETLKVHDVSNPGHG